MSRTSGILYDKGQSDYDNLYPSNGPPSLPASSVPPPLPPSNPGQRPTSLHAEVTPNGPPGYYQSLPQSNYSYQPSKENAQRQYTETISNFISGTFPPNSTDSPSLLPSTPYNSNFRK